jgi:hypothetical protein
MSRVKFIEETHQYFTEDDKELISVSAFTERFKKKVDWDEVARKYAAKKTKQGEPTTKEEVLKKWERKRDISAQIGTAYHAVREAHLLGQKAPTFYDTLCATKHCEHLDDIKYSIPISKLDNNTVYPELMIYDLDHMICGQADKVIVTGNRINIWDYKTDLEIKFAAFSSQWVSPAKLLPPVGHLDDCNGNIYSLKMSLYLYLLWKSNRGTLRPGDLIIEHVQLERDPSNDNIPVLRKGKPVVKKIEQIQLPYRKKEVQEMLETLKVKT